MRRVDEHRGDWKEWRRLRAWELAQQGWEQKKIAEALGVTEAAVSQWMKIGPRPIEAPGIWFKAAESQAVHDALVEAGVTILRRPSDGRFGRQFMFVDLDGYAITIYDRDAPAEGWGQTG